MTVTLILLSLVLVLFTGIPIFAGLTLFGATLLYFTQGGLGPISEVMFGEISRYLLVTIPLFTFMAHIMIRGRMVRKGTVVRIGRPIGVGAVEITLPNGFSTWCLRRQLGGKS